MRTAREFANGHPAGAVNIPVAFPDPARGMVMNPDFVNVVESKLCQRQKNHRRLPGRAALHAAAGMLQQAGYQDVANMLGGFGGMRDQIGQGGRAGLVGFGVAGEPG